MTLSSDSPVPLKRLIVHDGLLLNAHRWQKAHEYHRQRQNLHYQALHQSGIVYGLGVKAIAAPENIAAHYRDGRWVEVQPGIAIDRLGNPIIVDEPMAFRISSVAKEIPIAVHLVLSYVDPETLHRTSQDEIVSETFRIDEKTAPPTGLEVELCRIRLAPGTVRISPADNVFAPQLNQLDLRSRSLVGEKPQGIIKLAYLQANNESDRTTQANLSSLLQAFIALDPHRRGIDSEISPIKPEPAMQGSASEESWEDLAEREVSAWQGYDMIYLTYRQAAESNEFQQKKLAAYLAMGGVLFVELLEDETQVDELSFVQQELQEAMADIGDTEELEEVKAQLQEELEACEAELNRQISEICASIESLALNLGMSSSGLGVLSPLDSLQTQPFLFSALPIIRRNAIRVFNWGGVVLSIGDLSLAWGLHYGSDRLDLPREKIRNAQEFGVNLLHFAWHRRHLTQLQQ